MVLSPWPVPKYALFTFSFAEKQQGPGMLSIYCWHPGPFKSGSTNLLHVVFMPHGHFTSPLKRKWYFLLSRFLKDQSDVEF
jgi:hypothetical protein